MLCEYLNGYSQFAAPNGAHPMSHRIFVMLSVLALLLSNHASAASAASPTPAPTILWSVLEHAQGGDFYITLSSVKREYLYAAPAQQTVGAAQTSVTYFCGARFQSSDGPGNIRLLIKASAMSDLGCRSMMYKYVQKAQASRALVSWTHFYTNPYFVWLSGPSLMPARGTLVTQRAFFLIRMGELDGSFMHYGQTAGQVCGTVNLDTWATKIAQDYGVPRAQIFVIEASKISPGWSDMSALLRTTQPLTACPR